MRGGSQEGRIWTRPHKGTRDATARACGSRTVRIIQAVFAGTPVGATPLIPPQKRVISHACAPSVLQRPPAALDLAAVLLRVEARLARRAAGARLLPRLGHHQRLPHQLHEALVHPLLVLVLPAVVARGQQQPLLAAD